MAFCCSCLAAVIPHILQLIEQTKAAKLETNGEVRKILHILSSSGVNTSFKDYSETIESVKQMQSVNELLDFCRKLNENRNLHKLVTTVLFSLGRKDCAQRTRRMLNRLMSNALMVKFNYGGKGSKGKESFKDLPRLHDVLLDALKRHSDAPEVSDVFKQTTSEHLKQAKKRLENEEKKRLSAMAPGSVMCASSDSSPT